MTKGIFSSERRHLWATTISVNNSFPFPKFRNRFLSTCEPHDRAPNLIVLVHGCCTDENDVKNDWDTLANEIAKKITKQNDWEIVVWNWTRCTPDPNVECTPKPPIWDVLNFISQADASSKSFFRRGQGVEPNTPRSILFPEA
jgi:hypothetical protein